MIKLNPCPFCGITDICIKLLEVDVDFGREHDTRYMYEIECFNCGAKGPRKLYLEWAVERWNDRADVEEDS